MDVTLEAIIEFRDEMRELRIETRKTLAEHSHRLNVIEATIASPSASVRMNKNNLLGHHI